MKSKSGVLFLAVEMLIRPIIVLLQNCHFSPRIEQMTQNKPSCVVPFVAVLLS